MLLRFFDVCIVFFVCGKCDMLLINCCVFFCCIVICVCCWLMFFSIWEIFVLFCCRFCVKCFICDGLVKVFSGINVDLLLLVCMFKVCLILGYCFLVVEKLMLFVCWCNWMFMWCRVLVSCVWYCLVLLFLDSIIVESWVCCLLEMLNICVFGVGLCIRFVIFGEWKVICVLFCNIGCNWWFIVLLESVVCLFSICISVVFCVCLFLCWLWW